MKMNIEIKDEYQKRHIGPREADLNKMLQTIGVESMEDLIAKTIPRNIRLKEDINIAAGKSEFAFLPLTNFIIIAIIMPFKKKATSER